MSLNLLLVAILGVSACRSNNIELTRAANDPSAVFTPTKSTASTVTVVAETEEIMLADKYEINYVASGGRPPVEAHLKISSGGQGELFIGSSWSIPEGAVDRAGSFSGSVVKEKLAALYELIDAEKIFARSGGSPASSPDVATRYLSLKDGDKQSQLTIADTSNDPGLAAIEKSLIEIMRDLSSQPLEAVQVSVTTNVTGDEFVPAVELKNIGKEPLPILLYDPDDLNKQMRISLTYEQVYTLPSGIQMFPSLGSTLFSGEEIKSNNKEGSFPAGEKILAPGERYVIELPKQQIPTSSEPVFMTTQVTFWITAGGRETWPVHIQPLRISLDSGN